MIKKLFLLLMLITAQAQAASYFNDVVIENSCTLPFLIPLTALVLDSSDNIASSLTTATELGYVHGVTSSIQNQINSISMGSFLPLSGGTMTGNLFLNGDATSGTQAVTYNQFQGAIAGLQPKGTVRGATTGNITLSGLQTIDGVSLIDGDLELVQMQTSGINDGIYVVHSGAWTLAPNFLSGGNCAGTYVAVSQGTVYGGFSRLQQTTPCTIATTVQSWTPLGQTTYTAGSGLQLLTNTFSVLADGSTLSVSGSGVKVSTGGITNNEVNSSAAVVRSKLASGNINRVVVNDGSGIMADAASITPSRALISDVNGIPIASNVTSASLQTLISSIVGDGTATGPGTATLTLATVNSNTGTFGSASTVPQLVLNGKGLTTAAANVLIAIAETQVAGLPADLSARVLKAGDTMTGTLNSAIPGSLSVSNPMYSGTQTWNNAATTFTGFNINVVNTASNASSSLFNVGLGGSSRFNITPTLVNIPGPGTTFSVTGAARIGNVIIGQASNIGNTGGANGGSIDLANTAVSPFLITSVLNSTASSVFILNARPSTTQDLFTFQKSGTAFLKYDTNADQTLTPVWNAVGTTFTGLTVNVTDTASAAGSLLINLLDSSASKFSVNKSGVGTFAGTVTAPTFIGALTGNATTATSATNFTGSLSGDVTGTQGATALSTTSVTPGSYTNANIIVDGKGRLTSASNGSSGVISSVSNSDGTLVISPTTGAVVASRATITGDVSVPSTSNTSTLATVNSNVGSFGLMDQVSTFVVNAKGLITSASNTAIQITESAVMNLVTDLAGKLSNNLTNAHIFVGNGGNIASDVPVSGDLNLSNTGAMTLIPTGTSGTYGSSVSVPVFTTDNAGRVISVTNTGITFPPSSVISVFGRSGAVTANSGDYSFSQISGTISSAQLPNPTSTTLGGIRSAATVTSQWINSISTSGVPSLSQPGFSDISGSCTLAQLPSIANNTALANVSGSTGVPGAVVMSSTATSNAITIRDSSGNASFSNATSGSVAITSAAGTTTLTIASKRYQKVTGTNTQTIKMPDATTLTTGWVFEISNTSTQAVTVQNNSAGAIATMPTQSYLVAICTDISTAAGVWDYHWLLPSFYTSAQLLTGDGNNSPHLVNVGGDINMNNSGIMTIQANAVTLTKQAQLAANSIIGNNGGSSATPLALTVAQVKTMLNLVGTNSGDVTLSAFGSAPSATGASLATQALTLQPADSTHPGGVSIVAQVMAGLKTFLNGVASIHFIGSGSAPSIAVNAVTPGGGTGATASVSAGSTDTTMVITFTSGLGTIGTGSAIFTVSFNTPYAVAPNYISCSGGNANGGLAATTPGAPWYTTTTGGFTMFVGGSLTPSQTFTLLCHVFQ